MPFEIRTPRLLIEPLGAADITAFVAYRREPSVARWQSWEPSYSEHDARHLVDAQPSGIPEPGGWMQLAIRDASGVGLYGDVAVHSLQEQPGTFEIGMTLAPAAQGQGIAAEAVAHVVDYLFRVSRAHRVVAACDARNKAVARLLRRVGMRHECQHIEAEYFKGEWATIDGYAILAREHAQTWGC